MCLALTVTTDDVVGKLTSDEEVLFDQKLSSIVEFIINLFIYLIIIIIIHFS